jgi:hypothetical protein
MYRVPIITASLVFVTATLVELLAVEILRGSVVQWLAEPHKLVLVLVMIGINAVQGALFGYAAHRAALNAILLRQAEQDRCELTQRLGQELRPALSMVQYAAYTTADRRCIELCNEAIRRAVNTFAEASRSRSVA